MNWADSSDDEDEFFSPKNNPPVENPPVEAEDEHVPEPEPEPKPEPVRRKKDFVLPERPPYTAFVGNLAFSVTENLGQIVADLVKTRFDKEITVTSSRVALDRRDGNKPKGFGYVEVGTLDDLKVVLELDDGQSNVAGRAIHLDVAQPSSFNRGQSSGSLGGNRSQSFGADVDGAKFQGGRYQKKGSFQRQSSTSGPPSTSGGAPASRPSLKLQPRTQERSVSESSNTSDTNIFGGGKARELGSQWERPNSSVKEGGPDNKQRTSTGRGKGGREGGRSEGGRSEGTARGGGRSNEAGRGDGPAKVGLGNDGGRGFDGGRSNNGGRGEGSAREGRSSEGGRGRGRQAPGRVPSTGTSTRAKNDKKKDEKLEEKVKVPPAAIIPLVPAQPTKTVVNKFAALDFGDSDEE